MSGRKFDLGSDIFDSRSIYQASRTEAEVAFTTKLDNHSTRNFVLGEPIKILKGQKYILKVKEYILAGNFLLGEPMKILKGQRYHSKIKEYILARQPTHKKLCFIASLEFKFPR